MKKIYKSTLVVLLITGLLFACKKEESCPEITDMGQLTWSKETENWFPDKYINIPATLRFESEDGDILEFFSNEPKIFEGFFGTIVQDCENAEGTTKVRWADRRFAVSFTSPDSMQVSIGMGVRNEKLAFLHVVEANFYDWIAITVSRIQNPGKDLGSIRIVTDLRNSDLEDIDHAPNRFAIQENFEFLGKQYSTVFYDAKPDYENANIYFAKGQGLIGFKDEAGVKWKLLD